jgi:antitoxin component YwqK of YwqJK toxin-antitoxin module
MQKKILNSTIHGSHYPNGNWKSQNFCSNGARSGYQITWHENGNIKSSGNFENNEPTGLHKFWDDNGCLRDEIICKDGDAFTLLSGVNKVILVGNVVESHEIRDSSGNVTTTSLLIATSEWWTDKNTGHKQEKTEWHNIKIFGKLTEEAYWIFRGSKVYIEGRLQTNEYLDKTETNRCASEIVVSSSSNGVIKRVDIPHIDYEADFSLEPF